MGWTKAIEWVRDGECFRSTNHALSDCGYPQMQRNGIECSISRHILMHRVGSIGRNVHARHTCDHKWCVRPDHIISGTNADNMKDKIGRVVYRRGESHGNAKLTDTQVNDIRELLSDGKMFHSRIAWMYGVHPSLISKIKRNCNRRKPPSSPQSK